MRMPVFMTILMLYLGGIQADDKAQATLDQGAIWEKINLLGLRDDTLGYREKPLRWLRDRREQVMPQLIEGLDAPEKRIALGCLKLLSEVKDTGRPLEHFLRIASNRDHLIHSQTVLALCAYSEDRQASSILKQAVNDTERFPRPEDRASIAEALNQKAAAVALLVPLLQTKEDDSEIRKIIERLGQIKHPSALAPLRAMSHDSRWGLARQAYLSLAEIDPVRHGLTDDQRQFLTRRHHVGKRNQGASESLWTELAQLKKEEIRPFVMQKTASGSPESALFILERWQDKEAVPEIRRLLWEGKGRRERDFIRAYLTIDETGAAVRDVLQKISYRSISAEDAVRAVIDSNMTEKRQFHILSCFRAELGGQAVANAYYSRRGGNRILGLLMESETDVIALGKYARAACHDEHRRFGEQIATALEKVSSVESYSERQIYAVTSILDACAVYELPNCGDRTDPWLTVETPVRLRLAAAHVSARFGGNREKSLQWLYHILYDSRASVRRRACTYLQKIDCRNDQEKQVREAALLAHLFQPTEDYALRLLVTCAGMDTGERLPHMLDQEDVQRAVYGAWIMSQHPDSRVKERALRRLAIYGMLRFQGYQTGAGIDFYVADDLYFHQRTMDLNRRLTKPRSGPYIPTDLLQPFTWDKAEQQFALRAYRYVRLTRFHSHLLRVRRFGMPKPTTWDRSHRALLNVIAKEDPRLEPLHVKGKIVAYFPQRKAAAQIIAAITGEQAFYTGLGGEAIPSEQFPERPHDQQSRYVAGHMLDLIESIPFDSSPNDDRVREQREFISSMIYRWNDKRVNDPSYKMELIRQSERRDLIDRLRTAGFSVWHDLPQTDQPKEPMRRPAIRKSVIPRPPLRRPPK